jgi:ABC-2 type transport system ATP-binding protein
LISPPETPTPQVLEPRILEIRNLQVTYGEFIALELDELTLGTGTIGLLGPNGAGKSTLLRTIMGFRKPRRGSVKVLGLDMSEHLLEVRQRIGYVPENDVMSPTRSAVSFVAYCGELCGMRRNDALQATHQVLNYVGLGDERYRKISTYSLGMRQRVKLAQALVHDPELVFLDEPTNGLDPRARQEMLRLIRELYERRGVTVVLSTHLLPDVEAICDEVVVIGAGRKRCQGRLDELLASANQRYELGFVGDLDRVRQSLSACGLESEPGLKGRLVLELGIRSPSDVVLAVREAGAEIRHLAPLQQRLEEVFLAAVKDAKREGAFHAGV